MNKINKEEDDIDSLVLKYTDKNEKKNTFSKNYENNREINKENEFFLKIIPKSAYNSPKLGFNTRNNQKIMSSKKK